ncbi:MAG: GH1 family beta-glucosidase [Sphaerochaetaceae bacterium]|jgi:beta-glucosidase|nr:GH1 family beta-glucosidase [Sphaerochaetaceae bacterium]
MKLEFPEDFLWGSATASYQVEGATDEGGRKPSIWDVFCSEENRVANGDTGEIAADQYHRYAEDIVIMRELGLQAYRFSIAWPRIIPEGVGEVNEEGVTYYRNLMLALRKAGIKVVATLYHWDLPYSLELRGGWRSRDTVEAFRTYARVCVERFNDLVDQWITINEPWCISYLSHLIGEHAPGHQSLEETVKVIHHINLAHGMALAECRTQEIRKPVGISWNLFVPRNATRRSEDMEAARKSLIRESRVFTDPVLHGTYPSELGWQFPIEPGDMDIISQPMDFIGVNYYQETVLAADMQQESGYRVVPTWQPTTSQNWAINQYGLYRVLEWIAKEAPGIPLYITENGCASDDVIDPDGRVHDRDRIEYLIKHLEVAKQAIDDGIPLKGYYQWSFIDNFEWAWGYEKRFGIVYCDYKSLQRIIKDSGYFMRDIISGFCEY